MQTRLLRTSLGAAAWTLEAVSFPHVLSILGSMRLPLASLYTTYVTILNVGNWE